MRFSNTITLTGQRSNTRFNGSYGSDQVNDVNTTSGELADGALDILSGVIPFGGIAKKVLDKLGLEENIGLVSKYGLSSWGASTSPEQTKAEFAKTVFPFIQNELASITPQNVAKVVNGIEDLLLSNKYYYQALRDHHSNAKSTRLANDWAQKEFGSLRTKFIDAIRTEFTKYNVKFNRTRSKETAREMARSGAIYNLKNGKEFVVARDLDRYLAKQYYNWSVDYSKVKGLEVEEDGTVTEKTGFAKILTYGGLIFGAVKYFK